MPITISDYSFDGPFTSPAQLLDRAGVYVVLTRTVTATSYQVVDVGESAQVKTRIESHDRSPCWTRNSQGELSVAVLYTPNAHQSQRMQIEQALRDKFRPVCGIR